MAESNDLFFSEVAPAPADAPRAYDGDSFFREATDGDSARTARAVGFDAPEMRPYQGGAEASRVFFQDILDQPGTQIEQRGTDRYGRPLVDVTLKDGRPASEVMLQAGVANVFNETATPEQRGQAAGAAARRAIPNARTEFDDWAAADRKANPMQISFRDKQVLPSSMYRGDFAVAVDRGLAGMKESFGNAAEFLGSKIGSNTLAEWGTDTASRAAVDAALNPARIESFEDAKGFAETGTWLVEKIGENIPQIASMAVGGGGGGLLAAGIGKAFLKQAVSSAGKRALTTWGARSGAVAATAPQHLGEGWRELKDAGLAPDDTNLPFLTMAINTVLDVAPMEALLRFSFGGLRADMAKDLVKRATEQLARDGVLKSFGKGLAKGSLAGAAAEGPTELAQELVNLTARSYHDPEFRWDSPEVAKRLKEAFAGGVAVGGVFGGAGRGAGQAAGSLINRVPESGTNEPNSGTPPAPPAPPNAEQIADGTTPVAHAPETDDDLNAQIDALRDGKKMGVLLSADQPAGTAAARLANGSSIGALDRIDVPGKGTLYVVKGEGLTGELEAAVKAGDTARVDQLLGQITLGVSPEVAAVPPNEATAVVENLDEAGNAVSQVRVSPETQQQAMQDTAGQGATQRVATAEQALGRRMNPDALFGAPAAPAAPTPAPEVPPATNTGGQSPAGEAAATAPPAPSGAPEQSRQDARADAIEIENDTQQTGFEVGAPGEGVSVRSGEKLPVPIILAVPEMKDQLGTAVKVETAHKAVPSLRRVLAAVAADMNEDAREGADVKIEKTASGLRVDLTLPEEIGRNETTKRFVEKLVRAAFAGEVKPQDRVVMRSADGKADVKLNAPELAAAGFELLGTGVNPQTASKTETRQALLAAISWLIEKGWSLTDRSLPGDSARVAGSKRFTWKDVREAVSLFAERGLSPELQAQSTEDLIALRDKVAKQRERKIGKKEKVADETRMLRELDEFIARRAVAEQTGESMESLFFRDEPVFDAQPQVQRLETEAVGDVDSAGNERDETAPDVRGFDSEAQQNEASRNTPKQPTPTPASKSTETRANVVPGSDLDPGSVQLAFDPLMDRIAEGVAELLNAAGVRLERAVRLMDAGGIAALRKVANQMQGDARKANTAMLDALEAEKPLARVLFWRTGNGTEVRPVIYISSEVTNPKTRGKMVLHEVGHIVLRHFVENATPEQRAAMVKEFGEFAVEFEENFADAFMKHVLSKTSSTRDPIGGIVGRFFTEIYNTLRKVWLAARKWFDVDERYSEFIEALLNRGRNERGERLVPAKRASGEIGAPVKSELARLINESLVGEANKSGRDRDTDTARFSKQPTSTVMHALPGGVDYLNWTPKTRLAKIAANRKAQRLLRTGGRGLNALKAATKVMYQNILQPFDSRARAIGNAVATRFADHFRREPGKATSTVHGATFDDEVRSRLTPYLHRIEEIARKHIGAFRPWHLLPGVESPGMSAEMEQAVDQLIAGVPTSPLAKEIGQFFHDMYDDLTKQGVHIPFRKNYFPVAMSMQLLSQDGAKQRVIDKVKAWAQTDEAKAWWARKFKNDDGTPAQLTEQDAQRFGEHLFSVWTTGEGLADKSWDKDDFDFVSPGFAHRKQRQIPASLMDQMGEFRERDVVRLMSAYARSGMRRAVWQNRFGLNEEAGALRAELDAVRTMSRRDPAWQAMFDQMAGELKTRLPTDKEVWDRMWDQARASVDEKLRKHLEETGVDIFDPSAKLKLELRQELKDGRLDQEHFDWIVKQMIPGYEGTLGADMMLFGKSRPAFRRFSALVIAYQMLRVLSMAVFSQFVDVGASLNRAPYGHRWDLVGTALKAIVDKRSREQMREDARVIGAWHDDITEHLLSSDQSVFSGMDKAQKVTNWFFRINGMHAMTNWSRAVNMSLIKRLVESWAREGNEKPLAELGITVDEAHAWVRDGMPMQWQDQHGAVIGGLHQFVDESIIRPNAAMRPAIGNDQRFALLWSLKSFTWGYTMQVLGLAYNRAVQRWGEEEGARRLYAALPFILLGALTVPFAALGMEMRWTIAPPKNGPKEGWDYWFEALQRSGTTGLGQLLVDMWETEQHGKLSLIAPLGPAVSQVYDFATKDLGANLQRSLPAYPIMSRIGDFVSQ